MSYIKYAGGGLAFGVLFALMQMFGLPLPEWTNLPLAAFSSWVRLNHYSFCESFDCIPYFLAVSGIAWMFIVLIIFSIWKKRLS